MMTPPHGPSAPSWQIWRRLLTFMLPYRVWLTVAILAACGQAGVNIGFAFLTRHLTDAALTLQTQRFFALLYLALALILVGLVATAGKRYGTAFFQFHALRDLRNRVTGHLQRLPIAYVESHHSGDVVTRLNADVTQIETLIGHIPDHVYQPVLFVGAVVYMWLISWKLLLTIVVLIPLSAVVFNRVSQPLEENNRQLQEKLAATNAFVQNMLGGLAIVKAFNLQSIFTEQYGGIAEELQDKGITIDRINAYLTAIWLALRFIPQLVLPLYGGYLMLQGELSVGSFLATTTLMWYVFQPVEALLDLLRQIRETTPAMQRVLAFFDQPVEGHFLSTAPPPRLSKVANAAPLAFAAVSFGYNDDRNVLAGLSFALCPGEVVALVGPSGAGKSTILSLLCGFYQVQSGVITLFGQDTRHMAPATLRSQLSLVAQESYLFPTTIAENIRYGRLAATCDEIVAAARAANAHDFIMALPQGYETPVGERGNRLSGGQRQRIALARAMLKDAPILLLDEPTAALDTQSERLVEEALERLMGERTVLVIAHRLSTIQRADRVLVLDQGRIAESGSHKSLLAKDSLYRKLYLKQHEILPS
ncbi:MAG: ABC transporter ATP-binding protein [Caldilineaceae bacterium]